MDPNRRHILTVDVEDWPQSTLDPSLPVTGRVVDNSRRLLDVLGRHGVRGTFFVLGLVAEQFPELVREIHAAGHEVASHGYSHLPVHAMTPAAFAQDLADSVRLLEGITGARVWGYRAPDFSITRGSLWALRIIASQGLHYDSSIFPIRGPRYGIPESPRFPYRLPGGLIELPLATLHLAGRTWPVCGGGYFRLCPWQVTAWAMRRIQAQGQSAVLYLHPYELDPQELREIPWPVPLRMRLSQGLNRRLTVSKLDRLLPQFEFLPAAEMLGEMAAPSPPPAVLVPSTPPPG